MQVNIFLGAFHTRQTPSKQQGTWGECMRIEHAITAGRDAGCARRQTFGLSLAPQILALPVGCFSLKFIRVRPLSLHCMRRSKLTASFKPFFATTQLRVWER
eukprot:GHVT01103603.1.p1 GENE.GHVT01103603.1~~GHVT01103603.1.p1  ORF type:complete len:102 (+),score=4.75 GHVT01103603.1:644-949(+)